MTPQDMFNVAVALCAVLGGWVLKTIWDSINILKYDVKEITREINQDFVRREDFKDSIKEIKDMLGKIFDKLDGKLDKGD